MGNDHQLPLYLLCSVVQLRAAKLLLPCSLYKCKVPLCGWCSFPSESLLGALLEGFEITSGFPFMLLCLINHVTMYLPHTLFSYQRFNLFAQKSPDGMEEFISGICVYEENTTFFFFFFFCGFSVLKLTVVLQIILKSDLNSVF